MLQLLPYDPKADSLEASSEDEVALSQHAGGPLSSCTEVPCVP